MTLHRLGILLLVSTLSYGCYSSITSDYTFYYETFHYDFSIDSQVFNSSISVTDIFNNTYSFDGSGSITINDDISLSFYDDEHWREFHLPEMNISRRRRLFFGSLVSNGIKAGMAGVKAVNGRRQKSSVHPHGLKWDIDFD